jgi:hypothetical protein
LSSALRNRIRSNTDHEYLYSTARSADFNALHSIADPLDRLAVFGVAEVAELLMITT